MTARPAAVTVIAETTAEIDVTTDVMTDVMTAETGATTAEIGVTAIKVFHKWSHLFVAPPHLKRHGTFHFYQLFQ